MATASCPFPNIFNHSPDDEYCTASTLFLQASNATPYAQLDQYLAGRKRNRTSLSGPDAPEKEKEPEKTEEEEGGEEEGGEERGGEEEGEEGEEGGEEGGEEEEGGWEEEGGEEGGEEAPREVALEEGAKTRAAHFARFGTAALLAQLMAVISDLQTHVAVAGAPCCVPRPGLRSLLHTLLATGTELLGAVEDDMLAAQQRAWEY